MILSSQSCRPPLSLLCRGNRLSEAGKASVQAALAGSHVAKPSNFLHL